MTEWLTTNWRIVVIFVIVAAGLLLLWRRTATTNGIAAGSSFSVTGAASLAIAAIFIITLSEPRVLTYAMPALLIIVSIGIFVLLLVYAASSLKSDGITDATQPFGLPAGSIRAILTLSFVVLIGVFGSFVLSQSTGRVGLVPVEGLDGKLMEAAALKQFKDSLGPNFVVAAEVVTGDPNSVRVTVMSKADYATADDIAKQILNMLMTLVAAMIGFYFGAKIDGDPTQKTRDTTDDRLASLEIAATAADKAADDAEIKSKAAKEQYKTKNLEAAFKQRFDPAIAPLDVASTKLRLAISDARKLVNIGTPDIKLLEAAGKAVKAAQQELTKASTTFDEFTRANPP